MWVNKDTKNHKPMRSRYSLPFSVGRLARHDELDTASVPKIDGTRLGYFTSELL